MKEFAVWHDNGSGWFDGSQLVEASTPEEALQKAGGGSTPWGTPRVVTKSWDHDPNGEDGEKFILA